MVDPRLLDIFDDVLAEYFPKGECKERGNAVVLVAMAILQIEQN